MSERWPHVLLQWEDFARGNAGRLLNRYRDRLTTFNDDIQGTAAVCAGTLLAAVKVTGVPLTEQRIAIVGAGSAGCGIAALLKRAMIDAGLSEAEARSRFYAVDRDGLLVEGMAGILDFQAPFVQQRRSRRRLDARAAGQDRPARCGEERQADRADRRLGARRHVQRGHRARHGGDGRAADHLPALQSRPPARKPRRKT